MNIPKIEEAITLLYQTFIEDQDVATQRGIAITAMNEMVRLLGGVDVVAKIESVPYSARLRAQYLFEDEPPQRKPLTDTEVSLVAHNEDPEDWNSLEFRECWHEGFVVGFRAAEECHKIGV